MAEAEEKLEELFVSLVDKSWDLHYEHVRNRKMDDLLVGAVIAGNVGQGYALIDLQSDGVDHFLRFENLDTNVRLIFQLRNLTENLVEARILGRRARVVVGYGRMVGNFSRIWGAMKAELKSGMIAQDEPGIITFDADMAASYVYAQIPLILDLDQYFGSGYQVNYRLIQQHLKAVTHSLAKYLDGRIGE